MASVYVQAIEFNVAFSLTLIHFIGWQSEPTVCKAKREIPSTIYFNRIYHYNAEYSFAWLNNYE